MQVNIFVEKNIKYNVLHKITMMQYEYVKSWTRTGCFKEPLSDFQHAISQDPRQYFDMIC